MLCTALKAPHCMEWHYKKLGGVRRRLATSLQQLTKRRRRHINRGTTNLHNFMKMENKKRVKVAKEGKIEREREREEVYESTKVKLTSREADHRAA